MKKKIYAAFIGMCLIGSMIFPVYADRMTSPFFGMRGNCPRNMICQNENFQGQCIKLTGWIEDIATHTLKIKMDSLTNTLSIEKNMKIRINGKEGSLKDLSKGDYIQLSSLGQDMWITVIGKGNNKVYESILTGKIDDIDIEDCELEIKDGYDEKHIRIYKDTEVYINDQKKNLYDLNENMMVTVYMKENGAYKIVGTSLDKIDEKDVYSGKIINIELGATKKITLSNKDGMKTFIVDQSVKIYDDDQDLEPFQELLDEVGDWIKVKLNKGKVVEITMLD